jgi:hypothetical protein
LLKEKKLILGILILIGLAAGLISSKHRYAVEARNRRVEIVIDYAEAQLLANTTPHQAMDDTLTRLRQAGVTTVAVTEDTLQSLLSNGVILPPRLEGAKTLVTFSPGFPGQQQRVLENLQEKTQLTVTRVGKTGLLINAPWSQFDGTPIGLDDQDVRTVQRNGLLVAPRLYNFTGVTPQNIAWELAQTKQQCETPEGIGPLIFAGAAVLGDRPLTKYTAMGLLADHLTYGSVEFAKTFGDDELSRLAAARTVRVHSIGPDQMGSMDEPTAVDQFILGSRERNIRVCYVRLFTSGLAGQPDVVRANTSYIRKIVAGLRQAGLTVGGPFPAAHPYASDPLPSRLLRLCMGVGVAAGAVWLLMVFFGLEGNAFWIALGVSLLVGLVLAWPQTQMKAREILALFPACIFSTLGMCAFPLPRPRTSRLPSLRKTLARAFVPYVRMTLSTLAGVILVVGLLSGRLFLLKVDEFLGVKLVLISPILLVAAYYLLGLNALPPEAGWAAHRDRIAHSLRRIWTEPLLIGQVVVGLIGLALVVVLAMRSGNDPGIGVSPLEMKFRALLGAVLGVRPRTKEFLLGYPALFLALACAAGGRFPRVVVPLLILGAIGEGSLMDTFCHLHTPLLISSIRAGLGWGIGLILGILVYVIVQSVVPPAPRTEEAREPERTSARESVTQGA